MHKSLAILITAVTLGAATPSYANNDWVAPLIGGVIIGGVLNQMNNQPHYQQNYYYNQPQYYPQPQYYQPQVYCRNVPVYDAWGNFAGRQRQCWQQ